MILMITFWREIFAAKNGTRGLDKPPGKSPVCINVAVLMHCQARILFYAKKNKMFVQKGDSFDTELIYNKYIDIKW